MSDLSDRDSDVKILSQVEAEHLAECEALSVDIKNAFMSADWEDVRRKFYRQVAMVRFIVVIGLLLSFVVFAFYLPPQTYTTTNIIGSSSGVIVIWMFGTGFTSAFSFIAWLSRIKDNTWRVVRGGDLVGGVVVDILTLTFIRDYMAYTKTLFKTCSLWGAITSIFLLQALQVIYSANVAKIVISDGVSLYSVFFFGIIGIATILTMVTIKYCIRLWLADKEIINRY